MWVGHKLDLQKGLGLLSTSTELIEERINTKNRIFNKTEKKITNEILLKSVYILSLS
jgi:hypothetical protein